MSEYFIIFLCALCWGMGFVSCWLYSTLKIKELTCFNKNLKNALDFAGETIIEQNNEIHSILRKATDCESGIIN